MDTYDSIIIGAGHNGLTCAAYLARGGQKVLLLEAANQVGGLAADREFHPGFHASIAHSLSHFPKKIHEQLELGKHGWTPAGIALPTIGLNPSDPQAHVSLDGGRLNGVSEKDRTAFAEFKQQMQRFAQTLDPFWLKTIPRIGENNLRELLTFAHMGLNIRRLGKKDMGELLRIASLPVRDLMDEVFDNPVLKSLLGWDAMIGSKMAPRSPNGPVLTLLYRLSGASGFGHQIPAGGIAQVSASLAASASASGVEIRTGACVKRIMIDGDATGLKAQGVELTGGETIRADRVISAADPQTTFLKLVGVRHLDIGFTNRIRRLRSEGLVGKLHLALEGAPEFRGLAKAHGRLIIAPELESIELAYDKAKYGELPDHPVMEIMLPGMQSAGLAPSGKQVLSAHVMYVPYQLKAGWNDEQRLRMQEIAINTISEYAPTLREQIIHAEFLGPHDLEQQYRVSGGHWHHGEMAMDQILMMRPTYGAAQYSTPVPGLYQCSAGCHPGGDLTGMAGHNAAREILR